MTEARQAVYSVRLLCAVLEVQASGYYAWFKHPSSAREQLDQALLILIKLFWLESSGHYGYRNIHLDLQAAAIDCGRDRVLRLMQRAELRVQRGDKPPGVSSTKPGRMRGRRCFITSRCFTIRTDSTQIMVNYHQQNM